MRLFELSVPPQIYGGLRNYNKSENVVSFPNGSKLFFYVAQYEKDILQLNGHEYYAIFIDESTEFTFFMFQFLAAQNRCPVKFDIHGEPVHCFMALGSNPIGVGHDWHKALFIGEKQPDGTYLRNLKTVQKILPEVDEFDPADYAYVPALISDNPTYANDTAYLKKLEKLPEALQDAYLRGSWETNVGRYFCRHDPAEVVMDRHLVNRLIASQPWHQKWIGIDWGYNDFCATFWFTTVTIKNEEGTERDVTVVYREYITQGEGEEDLANNLVRLTAGEKIEAIYLSPDAWDKVGSANTVAEQLGDVFNDNNLPYPSKADDDRVGGARLIDEMLSRKIKLFDGERPMPDLFFGDDLTQLIYAIPRLMRDPKNQNDVMKVKREGDATDDIYDGVRYGLKSKLAAGDVPYAVLRQQILDAQPTNQARYFTDLSLKRMRKGTVGIRLGRPRFTAKGGRA